MTIRITLQRGTKMDIELNYIEKGEGTPLVLLHGNGESSDYFYDQIKFFSEQYRVIAIDTRGHGKSPRGNKSFTLEQFADDLKMFLDEMKISRIMLLGFSDGANIAILFALKYPKYLIKLVLNGADLHPSGVKRKYQIPIVMRYKFASFCAQFSKKARLKEEMLGLMVNQPDIRLEKLETIDIPTFIVVGTDDMIKQSHTEMIHRHIKNSELRVIEGDHFVARKNSYPFNKYLDDFLKKNV